MKYFTLGRNVKLHCFFCTCAFVYALLGKWANTPVGDVSGQTELLVQANGIRFHISLIEYTLGGESEEEHTGSGCFLCVP